MKMAIYETTEGGRVAVAPGVAIEEIVNPDRNSRTLFLTVGLIKTVIGTVGYNPYNMVGEFDKAVAKFEAAMNHEKEKENEHRATSVNVRDAEPD